MKPYVTDRKTKQVSHKNYSRRHWVLNRGVAGKRAAVRKWRSRKSARRMGKMNLEKE